MFKDKLKQILEFFDPVLLKDFQDSSYLNDESSFGNNLLINSVLSAFVETSKFELALVFVDTKRDSGNKVGSTQQIREELYRLKKPVKNIRIADLGNLKTGKSINETLFLLQEVCSFLFHQKINVVVIGGSQYLTLSGFRAFEEFENNINLVHIDSKIDLSEQPENFEKSFYLSNIIDNEASHIYNVSCLGYQSYLTDQKQIGLLNKLYFEHLRLGHIRTNLEQIEPTIRDGDMLSFDISAVRLSDAPAQYDGSPNGFYAEEACRIARYAGISDRNQLFGLYEIDADFDKNRQTVKLGAQIIWHYFDGYIHRKHEFPLASIEDCTKYSVQIDEIDFPIVFYKSEKSGRWWLEVKSINNEDNNVNAIVVSCSYNDYLTASKNEIPDRWWINFKKLE